MDFPLLDSGHIVIILSSPTVASVFDVCFATYTALNVESYAGREVSVLHRWPRSHHRHPPPDVGPPTPRPPPSPALGLAWTRVYKLWPKADRGQMVSGGVARQFVSWLVRRSVVASQSEREIERERETGQLLFQRCTFLPSSFVLRLFLCLPSSVVRLLPVVCLHLPPPVVRQPSLSSVFVVRLLVIRLRPSSARRLSSTVIRQFIITAHLQRHLQRFAQRHFVTSSPAVSASCQEEDDFIPFISGSVSINFPLISFTIRPAF